ncbi:hypothetical protein BDZ45DRAFT_374391 [Acephala macrosclerotiorum]|nr:hypothetical protein BDZ45DRAFT_374391 [Acephala macrosclerotiorum]
MELNNTLSTQNTVSKDFHMWGDTYPEKLQVVIMFLSIYGVLGSLFIGYLGFYFGLRKSRELMEKVEDELERDFPNSIVLVKFNATALDVWRGKWKNRGMQMELGNLEDDTPLPPYSATEAPVGPSSSVAAYEQSIEAARITVAEAQEATAATQQAIAAARQAGSRE